MKPYEVVCFGEVLWDILPDKSLPGGAPMNVAYHLKKLGANPALITRVGNDDYGRELVDLLTQNSLSTKYFQVDQEYSTGLVYAHLNENNEVGYDIVFPSAWDFLQWDDQLIQLMEESEFFVFGSLTSRNKTSRDTLYQLLELAKQRVLDINLRPPHFHRNDVEYLLRNTDILKMNISELELVAGWFNQFNTTDDKTKFLQERFKIETIIVTKGGDGAIVNHKGQSYHHPGYKVQVADTIGSGDSFLAGFLSERLKGSSIRDALFFASGLGAFIATKHGACPSYEISEIIALMKSSEQVASS